MSNFIYEIINQKIDFLKHSYKTNKIVNHQGTKGSLNELLLEELIKGVIPEKYKITKGIIQDSKGIQSNETDLIIYNPEILPSILFGNSLSFVPVEAVDYVFEIKSTLSASEIKTTIEKFNNCKKLEGFKGINSLFGFDTDLKNKSELERLSDYDKDFFYNPSMGVFTISNKGYYFFKIDKKFVNHDISKEQAIKQFSKGNFGNKISLNIDNFDDRKLMINGINYEEIFYKIYSWHGIEFDDNNCELLGFLSGISNTLSIEKFGKYLLENCDKVFKTYSYCIKDMWGNESYKKVDFNGFDFAKLNLGLSLTLNQDNKNNKIIVYENN